MGHVEMPVQKGVPVGHWHSSLSCLSRYGPKRLPPPKQAQLQQASPHIQLFMRPHVKSAERQLQTSRTTSFAKLTRLTRVQKTHKTKRGSRELPKHNMKSDPTSVAISYQHSTFTCHRPGVDPRKKLTSWSPTAAKEASCSKEDP